MRRGRRCDIRSSACFALDGFLGHVTAFTCFSLYFFLQCETMVYLMSRSVNPNNLLSINMHRCQDVYIQIHNANKKEVGTLIHGDLD